jgi:hypothetical protein
VTIVSLKNSLPFCVIASEHEATQLKFQKGVLLNRGMLENSVSWIASLVARKDEFFHPCALYLIKI